MMELVLTVAALIGLLIFVVGAILFLIARPNRPLNTMLMVIGALVWALATVILTLFALF